MEHAQRAKNGKSKHETRHSLNPYFNGTCSKRRQMSWRKHKTFTVLILILMEHAQRGRVGIQNGAKCGCLNPYFNGTCSKRA